MQFVFVLIIRTLQLLGGIIKKDNDKGNCFNTIY